MIGGPLVLFVVIVALLNLLLLYKLPVHRAFVMVGNTRSSIYPIKPPQQQRDQAHKPESRAMQPEQGKPAIAVEVEHQAAQDRVIDHAREPDSNDNASDALLDDDTDTEPRGPTSIDIVGKEGRALHLLNMKLPPESVLRVASELEQQLARVVGDRASSTKLPAMFKRTFLNTLETTSQIVMPGEFRSLPLTLPSVHVITGDIEALWLRDSAAQVLHYIRFALDDTPLQAIIEGLVRQQAAFLDIDLMSNAFRRTPWDRPLNAYELSEGKGGHIAERKYEVDSLAYFIRLSYEFWQATGTSASSYMSLETRVIPLIEYSTAITTHFDDQWHRIAWRIVCLWRQSQVDAPGSFSRDRTWLDDHRDIRKRCHKLEGLVSEYRHPELQSSVGSAVKSTGLLWSAFRPSDDKCTYHYLVPSSMFAVVELRHLNEIASMVLHDQTLARFALELANSSTFDLDAIHHRRRCHGQEVLIKSMSSR